MEVQVMEMNGAACFYCEKKSCAMINIAQGVLAENKTFCSLACLSSSLIRDEWNNDLRSQILFNTPEEQIVLLPNRMYLKSSYVC